MTSGSVLAVDMGGTKMAVGIVAADGHVVTHSRTPTPPAADAETIWSALLQAIEVLPGLGPPKYEPIKAITFHTRSTSKFYGDGYAVDAGCPRRSSTASAPRRRAWSQ